MTTVRRRKAAPSGALHVARGPLHDLIAAHPASVTWPCPLPRSAMPEREPDHTDRALLPWQAPGAGGSARNIPSRHAVSLNRTLASRPGEAKQDTQLFRLE